MDLGPAEGERARDRTAEDEREDGPERVGELRADEEAESGGESGRGRREEEDMRSQIIKERDQTGEENGIERI
jgi:hypothetical protein